MTRASGCRISKRPVDPLTFAGVAARLAVTAALATAIPAFRAARVDPMVALRQD